LCSEIRVFLAGNTEPTRRNRVGSFLRGKQMTKLDETHFLMEIRSKINDDKHGGYHRHFVNLLIQNGIIDSIPESLLDPYRPYPLDWKAFQVAYFDNGIPDSRRNRYTKDKTTGKSRIKIPRTSMQFGGNIRLWTRSKIDFSQQRQIAWQANFHCWTAGEAQSICIDLLNEKYIDQVTVDQMCTVIQQSGGGDDFRYSIPLLKTVGTRWMRNHIIVTHMNGGEPHAFVIDFPNQSFAS
jgi:hypothetical protein